MSTWMKGAIALNLIDNVQGDYHLTTRAKLLQHQWTERPMTNEMIAVVGAMAEQQEQRLIRGSSSFKWKPNVPIKDNYNDNDNNEEGDWEPQPVEEAPGAYLLDVPDDVDGMANQENKHEESNNEETSHDQPGVEHYKLKPVEETGDLESFLDHEDKRYESP